MIVPARQMILHIYELRWRIRQTNDITHIRVKVKGV